MDWNTLLCPRRIAEYQTRGSQKKSADLRTEFEKDYHRIIGSSAFRRLQDKTQVFPWDKSDFIRTRLTHSLEVSSLARSLGQNISESILQKRLDPRFIPAMEMDVCNVLQCAGLIHDIGNPPFGHFGEEAIRDWFRANLDGLEFKGRPVTELFSEQMKQDFLNFEGNAQALRMVSKLHYLVNENGMNLTVALLNTIIKYPVPSTEIGAVPGLSHEKMGYFQSEEELYRKISASCGTKGRRHPLTLILEAADDIAYRTADIEDAFKKGCITYSQLLSLLCEYLDPEFREKDNYPVNVLKAQYRKAIERKDRNPEQYAISNFIVRMQGYLLYCATASFTSHYSEIMNGTWEQDLFYGTPGAALCDALGKIAYDNAFTSIPIMRLEIAANQMICYFLDHFIRAFLYYDTDCPLGLMEDKFVHLISDSYIQIYHFYAKGKSEAERLYLRFLLVTDYVSGMTDSFAKDLYQELNGID